MPLRLAQLRLRVYVTALSGRLRWKRSSLEQLEGLKTTWQLCPHIKPIKVLWHILTSQPRISDPISARVVIGLVCPEHNAGDVRQ